MLTSFSLLPSLGVRAKRERKATIYLAMDVHRPALLHERLHSHWTHFYKVLYLGFILKLLFFLNFTFCKTTQEKQT
jgi:hypothetical protein